MHRVRHEPAFRTRPAIGERKLRALVRGIGHHAAVPFGLLFQSPQAQRRVVKATRRHVDDDPVVQCAGIDELLGQREVTEQVQRVRAFEPFRSESVRMVELADVVDEDVELAASPHHLVRECQVGGDQLQVELQRHDARAALLRQRLQRSFVATDGQHGRAALCGAECDPLADAARRARDQPGLTLERRVQRSQRQPSRHVTDGGERRREAAVEHHDFHPHRHLGRLEFRLGFRLGIGHDACPLLQLKISNRPAAPMPPPTHIVTTPYFAPRRRPSCSRCPTQRAPVMPKG